MAAQADPALGTVIHRVVDDHDLVIGLTEYEQVIQDQKRVSIPRIHHEYYVKREVLLASNSPYFRTLLGAGYKESHQTTIALHDDQPTAVDICFRLMHDTLDSASFEVSIEDVWYMLLASEKYGLSPQTSQAKAWFARWYDTQMEIFSQTRSSFNFFECQQLLLPCHTFDHAKGFKATTKFLVYNGKRHITEKRPEGFHHDHLRLTQGVIQQVNAAKGRLRTILHRSLYNPIERLVTKVTCEHKEEVLYDYEKSLCKTHAWPLEAKFQNKSVSDILRLLKHFEYAPRTDNSGHGAESAHGSVCDGEDTDSSSCDDKCASDFEYVVQQAVSECERYFDGLCLDCMNMSKLGDKDQDYWQHDRMERWDMKCRTNHGQPTWYFSFMGRAEKRILWLNKKREARRWAGYHRSDDDSD